MELSTKLFDAYSRISTATITTVLLKHGIRNAYMRGPKFLCGSHEKIVGEAFTLRFVPAREDLATPESWSNPVSTRSAIEAMPAGVVVVADAMGVTDAGILGDILCQRMRVKDVAGLVTDGVMRDAVGVLGTGLPVWCQGVAARPSVAGLTFVGWQEPIACGGVAIFPGDLIVADGDGVVVVPQALIEATAVAGLEQELFESWVHKEVVRGVPLPGLYPPDDETRARFQAWRDGGDEG
jgi:regulator of RNase E activity RraA